MKFRNLFINTLILSTAILICNVANASTFICKRNLENDNAQLVLINGAFLLACQSPKSVDLNQEGMKLKYCAAASILINNSIATQSGGFRSGTLSAQVVSSILNEVPADLNIELNYKESADGIVGHIKVSEGTVSSTPVITLPNEADYTCVVRD